MSLWRWMWGGDQSRPEGTSDRQRLEQLLYRLADDIANDDDDKITLHWSREVRAYAGQVGAGQPSGLRNFLRLFDTDPRNAINEQRFARTRTFDEASRLASKLLEEHDRAEDRLRAAEREVVLRPWREGSTGKAVVYADGTIITSEDDAGGEPQFEDIEDARQRRAPVALIGIKEDGSCDAYRNLRDEPWLAARLHDHHPTLHLGPRP
jgi:hypothetical protein